MSDTAPLILTAMLGPEDHRWADDLRQAHFPPERNQLAAHLTMFHALPPSAAPELKRRIVDETRGVAAPDASVARILDLGGGTALGIQSPGLVEIRARIADAFHGSLTAQDAQGWRPHITIQNKVTRDAAKALQAAMSADFRPRAIRIHGLAAWAYRGGPWEPLFEARFA
ncbi:hypothetical protein GGR88_000775 [Sphingomonas jejuensis]|uniref:2'-5' RNA ligase superfamily protein n=1 Tax=Sphingomonas jejuensis TaxID=904715 RepID=A0ABX0XKI8_9SPHN|nr:hypothetical protein [Sphingomonas jejuensis]